MPNHIQTQVEITSSKERIDKLVKDTKLIRDSDAAENQFDFNGIIKMPPELNITSGSTTNLGMAAYDQKAFNTYSEYPWFAEHYPKVKTPDDLRLFLENMDSEVNKQALKDGKQALENLKQHGYEDWYGWSNAKWGTKWNAYDVRYINGNDTTLVFEITTAWNTPQPIWDMLEELGYRVCGVVYGEMDGTDLVGDKDRALEVFDVNTTVEVDYYG